MLFEGERVARERRYSLVSYAQLFTTDVADVFYRFAVFFNLAEEGFLSL